MKNNLLIILVLALFSHVLIGQSRVPSPKTQLLKEGDYFIQNRETGLYMDMPGSSKENGIFPISYPFRGKDNQLFCVKPQSDGTYILENVNSKKALSSGSGNPLLSKIYQVTSYPTPEHCWQMILTTAEEDKVSYFKIISDKNGNCLQAGKADYASSRKGSYIMQNRSYYLGQRNKYQQWKFIPKSNMVKTSVQSNNRVQALISTPSLVEAEPETSGFTVFPNPAQNQVTVAYTLSEGETAQITLVNMLGIEVSNHAVVSAKTVIDVSTLNEGVYILNLQSDSGKRLSQKLLIKK